MELGDPFDLVTEPPRPEGLESRLFCQNAALEACDLFLAEAKFFLDRGHQLGQVDSREDCQEPEVVKVPGFVPRPVLECDHFFGGDFVQTVNRDQAVFGKVIKFRLRP